MALLGLGATWEMGVFDWGEEEFKEIQLVFAWEQSWWFENSEDTPW